MNLSLTMNFASLEEMQAFLSRQPSNVPTIENTETGPAVVETVVTVTGDVSAAPAKAAPGKANPPPAEIPATDPGVDYNALRTELMGKLRTQAETMDDPGQLGKFINGFGVARFSELSDDQLPGFAAAFDLEYSA